MDFGAFAGGAADGFQSGYRTGILGANLKSQQENDARRLKIQEEQNARQGELQGLQIAGAKREMERQQALEAAHKQALQLMSGATGAPMDPNMPADQQIARFVTGGLNDPRTLSAVADVYAKAGHPDAAKWIERGYLAKKEGVLDLADALKRGDTAEAKRLYNAVGNVRLSDIKHGEGKEGTPTGKYRLKFEDGEEQDVDPDSLMRSVFSYSEWRNLQDSARKAQMDAEKNAAEVRAKNASAFKDEGANATSIEVAKIQADKARDVKSMDIEARANSGGGGRGRGRGSDKDPDPWKDAEQRNKVYKEVDEFVMQRFGERDPVKGDARHTERSREISNVAAQIMESAVERKARLTLQDAVELAAVAKPVWTPPVYDPKQGRFVTKQEGFEARNAIYPVSSAVVPAQKEQMLQHLDAVAQIARDKKITPEQMKKATNFEAMAKQAGLSVDEAIKRIFPDMPAAQTTKPSAKGGETRGIAGAQKSGAPTPRSGGILGEIQALEDRLSAIPDDGRLSTKTQRGEIEKKITQLRGVSENQENREAVIPSQRVATAAKVRELEERLAKLPDDGRLSTKTQRGQLERQIDELKSALRRSAGGGITREIK